MSNYYVFGLELGEERGTGVAKELINNIFFFPTEAEIYFRTVKPKTSGSSPKRRREEMRLYFRKIMGGKDDGEYIIFYNSINSKDLYPHPGPRTLYDE